MGGFYTFDVLSDCASSAKVLSWHSDDGNKGLWACSDPESQHPRHKVLMASVAEFTGEGCVALDGIQMHEAGDDYGAWAYT